MKRDIPKVNMHEFKTNLAKYVRMLEADEAMGVLVQRDGRPAAILIPYRGPKNGQPPQGQKPG